MSAGSSLRTVRAYEDCIALGTESMGVGAGFRSGDPLRSAVGRCRPAIEAGGKLGDHEWTTRSSMVEAGQLLGDKIGTDADGDLNPAASSVLMPLPAT